MYRISCLSVFWRFASVNHESHLASISFIRSKTQSGLKVHVTGQDFDSGLKVDEFILVDKYLLTSGCFIPFLALNTIRLRRMSDFISVSRIAPVSYTDVCQ